MQDHLLKAIPHRCERVQNQRKAQHAAKIEKVASSRLIGTNPEACFFCLHSVPG
jgi:hypothetical protein